MYYSKTAPVSVHWFRYEEELDNSMSFFFNSTNTLVKIPVYEKEVTCPGYWTSLTVTKPVYGEYTVVLENKFGKIKHRFEWDSGETLSIHTMFAFIMFMFTEATSTHHYNVSQIETKSEALKRLC